MFATMRVVVGLLVVLVGCSSPEVARPVKLAPAGKPVAPVVATRADPAPPVFRLPGDVVPASYALDFTIVPDQPTAAGNLHIAATVVRAARVVWLNATDLVIRHAELDGRPARVIPGGPDFIGLAADRELAPGAVAIDVAFTAAIDRQKSQGIYSEREGNDAYVYTFFEPIDARRAFPCFDEPSYKVPWQLTFHVKADQVALGNAPVVRETAEPGGMKRVELAITKPLPSYLVAFVVGPFELIDGGTAGRIQTPIRFIIPKGRAGELGYAREVTPKVLVALERYFDMDYPYAKLDVAVVARGWGTMEHPGIVAMGQPLTLIRPEQATRDRKFSYANTLAHELSHYWFGDLVTMAWWDDTWLNEALGEWSDINITEAAEPTWRVRDERVWLAVGAMVADETLSTQSIRQPVTTREGIAASFDGAITYLKGASVFRMFESFVGPEPWRSFLLRYLAAHAWGNASADDFLRALAADLGPATAEALRSFLEQPGLPRISTQITCHAGGAAELAIAQQRALPAEVLDPTPRPRRWSVPVCVRYGDARAGFQTCSLLAAERATVRLAPPTGTPRWSGCPTWTIGNADAVGYYRAAVDPAMARALLTAGSPLARAAKPTAAERMMLLEDLRAARTRGELPLEQLLAFVPVVAADPDPKVAARAPGAAAIALPSLDDALYRAAKRWYHAAFHVRAAQLGWQRRAGDSEELRRALVPMIARADAALTAEATRRAELWLAHRTGLPDDLVWPALAVAAYHGDAARFDRYLAQVRAARDRTEYTGLLGTLGAFTDPKLATRALGLVLDPAFDLRDTVDILLGVISQRETRDLGLAFVTAHLGELLARMRDDEAAGLLGWLAGGFCDPARRAQIAALVVPRAATIDGAQASVTRSLERADQCIARAARELPALRRVLTAN